MTIAAIVLAAGRSTRSGPVHKLTAAVAGKALVAHAVDAALASPARPVVVVTGHEAAAVRDALAGRSVTFVHNPDYARGMASSIAAGIRSLPGEAEGALIALGDMPGVAADDIARLLAAFDPARAPICVPVASGRRGNPVLFARAFFGALTALEGDQGARALIAGHPDLVREVPMAGAGTLADLDTEADIAAYDRDKSQGGA